MAAIKLDEKTKKLIREKLASGEPFTVMGVFDQRVFNDPDDHIVFVKCSEPPAASSHLRDITGMLDHSKTPIFWAKTDEDNVARLLQDEEDTEGYAVSIVIANGREG